jgi:hypothetical protein
LVGAMQRIYDAFLTTGSIGVIVAGLAAMNDDVRRHIMNLVAGNVVSELAVVAAPVNRAATAAMKTLNDYQTDNGPLFAFGVAAVVLFGFLFKM